MNLDPVKPYLIFQGNDGDKLVLQFVDGRFECADKVFKKAMDNLGIQIPPEKRREFNGKRFVYPADGELFETAFRQVYYPLHMPKNEYYWSLINPFDPKHR